MRRSSAAVTAEVRRRMGPPHRQSVAQIFQELGIHVITLYKWRKAWRLQGEVVHASQKDPEGWGRTTPAGHSKASSRPAPGWRHLWIGTTTSTATAASGS
jgi:transposase-like protein